MGQAPLEKRHGDQAPGKALVGRCGGLDSPGGPAHGLVARDVLPRTRPPLLLERPAGLGRERARGTQNRRRGFLPMVPAPKQPTACKRHRGKLPPAGPAPRGPASLVGSGQRHALRPLLPECVGPWCALLVAQRALGRARTPPVPALRAAALPEARGGLPTVAEDLHVAPRREQRLSARQPVAGAAGVLPTPATMRWRAGPVATPDGVRPARQPPLRGIGPSPKREADGERHGARRGVGGLLAVPLGRVRLGGNRVEIARPRVVLPDRVSEAYRKRPSLGCVSGGPQGCHRTGADRRAPGCGRPRTEAQPVGPRGRVGGLAKEAIPPGDGVGPGF